MGRLGYDPVSLRETHGVSVSASSHAAMGMRSRGGSRQGMFSTGGVDPGPGRRMSGRGSQAETIRSARNGLRGAGGTSGHFGKPPSDPVLARGGAWSRLEAVERGGLAAPGVVAPAEPRREAGAAVRARLESRGAGGSTAAAMGLLLG